MEHNCAYQYHDKSDTAKTYSSTFFSKFLLVGKNYFFFPVDLLFSQCQTRVSIWHCLQFVVWIETSQLRLNNRATKWIIHEKRETIFVSSLLTFPEILFFDIIYQLINTIESCMGKSEPFLKISPCGTLHDTGRKVVLFNDSSNFLVICSQHFSLPHKLFNSLYHKPTQKNTLQTFRWGEDASCFFIASIWTLDVVWYKNFETPPEIFLPQPLHIYPEEYTRTDIWSFSYHCRIQ